MKLSWESIGSADLKVRVCVLPVLNIRGVAVTIETLNMNVMYAYEAFGLICEKTQSIVAAF